MKRHPRATRLLGVCLPGLVAIAVAGCGATSSGGSGSAKAAGSGSSSELVSELVDAYFPATSAQAVDGLRFFNFQNLLQITVAGHCLAAHGWKVRLPAVSSATLDTGAASGGGDGLPNLAWIRAHDRFAPLGGEGVVGITWRDKSAAEHADDAHCVASGGNPLNAFDNAINPIAATWYQIVTRIQRSPRLAAQRSRFSSCLTHQGASVKGSSSVSEFLGYWEPETYLAQPRGADRIAFARRWAKIFVRCATPLITAQQRLQEARRKAFLQAHYQEITAAENAAARGLAKQERSTGISDSIVGRTS
jgi:hypothetical protein